jgi:hypothetical protein
VAIIDSLSCNGGALPTTGGLLGSFDYHVLQVASVSLAALSAGGVCGSADCDTALLNVCSAGMGCTTGGLTAAAKADLAAFVGAGHKLIIYDSECPGVDYSWIPFPFASAPLNPAPTPPGTVSITEENTLSSAQQDNSHFINTGVLGGFCGADQVQSANQLLSGDTAWCVDMLGVKGPAGPVHLYASYSGGSGKTGLFIYNGLDLDNACGDPPGTLTACQNLSKIWLQELQQPTDPSCLPCQQALPGCDDGNPCTDDSFSGGQCVHTNNTGPCDDHNACTLTDTCQNGACTGSNPVVCAALDACHVAGVCDTATGLCSNPPGPNGTPCDDHNACTLTDTCQNGACTGGNPVVCTALDACHVAGVCDVATGLCSNPPAPNGTSCSDGNACTQTDTCQNGACTGGNPVVCAPLDQCHIAGTCNTNTGACTNPPAPDGTPCSDGLACTVNDMCAGGVCGGTTVAELCNSVDDNCNALVDETPCVKTIFGSGETAVPGGTGSFSVAVFVKSGTPPATGNFGFLDNVTGLYIKETSITSITALAPNKVTFSGDCISTVNNGSPVICTYTVTLEDLANPSGVGQDVLTLNVSAPTVQYGPTTVTLGNFKVNVQ